ncbi:hypothetical protein [Ancylobacter sp. SL191]|uniref:hypothetical protein n=1 Tax=Ancylobacter sp. SL191 TaxID=2995166 RepID=UPI0022706EA6|nr:hypothetical protein [Ancylobacter sp. SL191]WAC26322.1 hypothetical protein OU996_15050 [Ancylobacter sp. SL191]
MKELMPAQPCDAGTLCFSPLGAAALFTSGLCLAAAVVAGAMGSPLLCLGAVLVTAALWLVAAQDAASVLLRLAREARRSPMGGPRHGG